MSINEILKGYDEDSTMKCLKKIIQQNKYDMGKLTEHQKNEIKNYIRIKEELCCTVDGLILRGTRILIPNKLQNRVIDIAHEGHLGIVKTKQLLREKVWFTGLDKLVEDKIRNCIQCQACTPDHSKPEVHMS